MVPEPGPLDGRPWERPGAVRRDCEPHRGGLLRLMARSALAASALDMPLSCIPVPDLVGSQNVPPGGPVGSTWAPLVMATGLASLAVLLGVSAAWLAGRDLLRMRSGETDPAGEKHTEGARQAGLWGAGLGMAVLVAMLALRTLVRAL
jgi:hypothetical protein